MGNSLEWWDVMEGLMENDEISEVKMKQLSAYLTSLVACQTSDFSSIH